MADQDPYAAIATPVQSAPAAPQPSASPAAQASNPNDPYASIATPIQTPPPPTQNPNEPLGTFGKIFLGPNTAAGAPLPDTWKEEGSGVSDIMHGDISQGFNKIVHAETPHVISGSPIEKLIQQFKPDFKGSMSPEQAEFQDRQVHAGRDNPLFDAAQAIDKDQHPVLKALTEAAQSLTSPGNVATMIATGGMGLVESPKALAVANRLLSAGFTASAVGQAYKNLKSFKEAYDKGDANDALYQLTHAVTSGTMAYLAGTHAAGKPVGEAQPSTELGKMAQERVVEPIAQGVGKAVSATGEAVANAAGNVTEGVKKGLGIGDDFYTTVKKISPPSKGAAMEYNDSLKTAEPQLREVFRQNPDVQTPKDMHDAIDEHIKQTEARLGAKAAEFEGKPEAQMTGVESQVRADLEKAFDENKGQYKPEEKEKAIQSVMSHLLQEEPGQLEGTKTSREPSLAEAEGVRRRFNDDTQASFGSNAPAVPAAEAFAKKAAANSLRQAIDQKFDDLGVTDVKEWRKQEAGLIDVRNQIANAVKKSEEMGNYNVFESLTKQLGWKTLLGFAAGAGGGTETGLAGALAASGLGAVADYIRDLKLNPNRKVAKASKLANEPGPTGAALPREKPTANPTQATGGSDQGSIDLELRPYEVPNESTLNAPTNRRPSGFLPGDEHIHEWGHTTNAALEDWGTEGIKSHLNESLGKRTSAAATVIPKNIDWKDPDSVSYNLGKIASVILGGAAADELHSQIPFETNQGLHGDMNALKKGLSALNLTDDEFDSVIRYGRDRATRNLTQPEIGDILVKNAKVREKDLHPSMHASPERTESYANEVRRIRDENRARKGNDDQGVDREVGRVDKQLYSGTEGEVQKEPSKASQETLRPDEVRDLNLTKGLKEHTTGDDQVDDDIRSAGAIPSGSMANLALFHDPETGSTLALDKKDVTPELVKQHLSDSREKFGVKPAEDKSKSITVYRGGEEGKPGRFGSTYYAEDPNYANEYTSEKGRSVLKKEIRPQNPLDISISEDALKVAQAMAESAGSEHLKEVPEFAKEIQKNGISFIDAKAATKLREQGYDFITQPKDAFSGDLPTGKIWIDLGSDLEKIVNDAKKSNGGFVADLRTGKSTDTGYLVEMMPEKRMTLDHDATPKDIQKFYNDNRKLFKEHPELRIGGYKNELNISAHTTDQATAEKLAKKLDQRSVWDVKNGEEIPTGGHGKATDFPNYQFHDRMKELRGDIGR